MSACSTIVRMKNPVSETGNGISAYYYRLKANAAKQSTAWIIAKR